MYHNVNESEFFASFTLPCCWIAVPYRKVRLKMYSFLFDDNELM